MKQIHILQNVRHENILLNIKHTSFAFSSLQRTKKKFRSILNKVVISKSAFFYLHFHVLSNMELHRIKVVSDQEQLGSLRL